MQISSNELIVKDAFLGSDLEDSTCKARDQGSVHGSGDPPKRNSPLQYSCRSHGQWSLRGWEGGGLAHGVARV